MGDKGGVYAAQWARLRVMERRERLWRLFVVGAALAGFALMRLVHTAIPFYVLVGVGFAACFVVQFPRVFFRCPRCGHHFFVGTWLQNMSARRCMNCGLPKWSSDGPA